MKILASTSLLIIALLSGLLYALPASATAPTPTPAPASNSLLHRLTVTNKGLKSLKVCDRWERKKETTSSVSCSQNNYKTARIATGETSRERGIEDADAIQVPRDLYKLQRQKRTVGLGRDRFGLPKAVIGWEWVTVVGKQSQTKYHRVSPKPGLYNGNFRLVRAN